MADVPAPRFAIVDAQLHSCPYLPGQLARTPLRLPMEPISGPTFDRLLAQGDRRAGVLLYRTQCPSCSACEPLRIPVRRFTPSRSQRRVQRRNQDVRVEVRPAVAAPDRVALYNRHRTERGLAVDDADITVEAYQTHYVDSCVATREVDYFDGDRLIGFSVLDLGATSASSVYHCFDPDVSRRSLGVFSVAKEIALCEEWGLDWYYLGLWVGECASLRYKSQYFPHERLRGGVWHEHAAAEGDGDG